MKKLLLALLLYWMYSAAAGPAMAGEQDFTLVNKTGVEIFELYISPASADDWQEDVLSVDTLPDGEEIEIVFSRDEGADLWDIRIVDGEGASIDWTGMRLAQISTIILLFENGEPIARYE